jgi:polyphenol oxidase
MTLFEWQAPGPYRVAFSTRIGGVSEGAFASLNLGVYTDDDPERVRENRRRLCAELGVEPETATMAWQFHSAEVVKADGRGIVTPGLEFERCDGLWTDEPGRGLMLLTADCLPIAIARTNGTPAVCVLHAGWRGLLADGVVVGRNLDLAEAAERALRAAGCATVERVGLCSSCEEALFFSHRRDRGRTGRQGIVAALH